MSRVLLGASLLSFLCFLVLLAVLIGNYEETNQRVIEAKLDHQKALDKLCVTTQKYIDTVAKEPNLTIEQKESEIQSRANYINTRGEEAGYPCNPPLNIPELTQNTTTKTNQEPSWQLVETYEGIIKAYMAFDGIIEFYPDARSKHDFLGPWETGAAQLRVNISHMSLQNPETVGNFTVTLFYNDENCNPLQIIDRSPREYFKFGTGKCPILQEIELKDRQESIILNGSDYYFVYVYIEKGRGLSPTHFLELEDRTFGKWTLTVEELRKRS